MFNELDAKDFCDKWFSKEPKYGRRKVCCQKLAIITGYEENTCRNWLIKDAETPKVVRKLLGVVDILLEIKEKVPSLEAIGESEIRSQTPSLKAIGELKMNHH